MERSDIYVIIMAGGVGSRFWPYSKNGKPKQFLDVLSTGKTLMQMTFERFLPLCEEQNFYIVTNEKYQHLVAEQLPSLNQEQILAEPNKRNTAPCIAYACYKIKKQNPHARIVVTPADHAIFKEELFLHTIQTALEASGDVDKLITLGIQPNRPETGYGYIQYYQENPEPVKKVKTFTEKPQLELAKKFLESGDFVWNAGIFIWHVGAIIKAFEEYLPDMAELFDQASSDFYSKNETSAIKYVYSHCRNISIDYGIMENSSNVYVVLGDFDWSDLGSWNSLHEILDKDDNDNVFDANILSYDTRNSIVKSENKKKLIIVQGMEDFLVADSDDVLLVCKKDLEAKLRVIVDDVKNQKGEEFL